MKLQIQPEVVLVNGATLMLIRLRSEWNHNVRDIVCSFCELASL